MAQSRQQRRQAERELTRIGERVIAHGLARQPDFDAALGLAFVLARTLTGTGDESGAGAAAGRVHQAYEAASLAAPKVATLACRKGCAYCCHAMVTVTAPEAFRLAAAVRSAVPDIAEFARRAGPTANVPSAKRLGAKLPCPLLAAGGACSVYAIRPLACRRVVAFAVEPCIGEFEGEDGVIAVPQAPVARATHAQISLLAALRALGRPIDLYELSGAVARVLATPDAEARWLAGEDVFAGVFTEPTRDPAVVAAIDRLATALAGDGGSA